MTPLTSTDPSDIANAARCFASCVPPGMQGPLKTYLLTQVADIATPPCVTPTAPTLQSVTAYALGDPTTQLRVAWKQPANTGSLIIGYNISWGTTSGVYTDTAFQGVAFDGIYLITGLTAGTTYFVVVQAVTSISGCVSAVSNERSGATSGAPPTPPLNGSLISYWKFDEAASGAAHVDSVDGNTFTDADTESASPGVINNCYGCSGGTNRGFRQGVGTVGQIAAGESFTFSGWFNWLNSGFYNGRPFLAKALSTLASEEYYLLPDTPFGNNNLLWKVRNAANNATVTLDTGFNPFAVLNTFHHYVFGYDEANHQIFTQVDAGPRQTAACVGVNSASNLLTVGAFSDYLLGNTLRVDEIGFWKRVLTTAEVTTLYNGGAGYALSNFYP